MPKISHSHSISGRTRWCSSALNRPPKLSCAAGKRICRLHSKWKSSPSTVEQIYWINQQYNRHEPAGFNHRLVVASNTFTYRQPGTHVLSSGHRNISQRSRRSKGSAKKEHLPTDGWASMRGGLKGCYMLTWPLYTHRLLMLQIWMGCDLKPFTD